MKKILKSILSISLFVVILFGIVACSTPISNTTADNQKTLVNGVSTNGGTTAVYGEYLYFVNGTKANDGNSGRGTTQGAICRIKYDVATGKVEEGAQVEIVVSDLVGFEDGSINIFGDFLYYTTPNNQKNHQGTTLFSKTDFKRYDLVNNKDYTIYTTRQNDSKEVVSFAYYVVEEELYLLVYESVAKVLTSIKVSNNSINYQIFDVTSCVFSDNNGKSVDDNVKDANNFVFYTKAFTIAEDGRDTGAKVYKTAPNEDSSEWMGNEAADGWKYNLVSILSIKNGKLIYSVESEIITDASKKNVVYAQVIRKTGDNSKLLFNESDIISYDAFDEEKDCLMFNELSDGNISIIAYNSTSKQIVYIENEQNIRHTIIGFDEDKDMDFVGVSVVKEALEANEGEDPEYDEVEYLLYTITESSKTTLYKAEVKRNGVVSADQNVKVVISDSDGMIAINGLIMPEVVGNNVFVIANDKDKNAYMHYLDLSKDVDDDNKVTFLGKK